MVVNLMVGGMYLSKVTVKSHFRQDRFFTVHKDGVEVGCLDLWESNLVEVGTSFDGTKTLATRKR